jgi:cytochrome P450
VSDLPKSTGSNPETLTTDGRDHIIPPRTVISINIYAIHTDPDLWGSDSLIWRPQRWLTPTDSDADSVTVGKEMLMERPGGMFAPWSEGPRNCPGQKFSQVEFVAVTALLFRNHRVRPVLREGQSVEDGKKELMRMANDSAIDFMMRMRNPKRVSLKWVRKDDE